MKQNNNTDFDLISDYQQGNEDAFTRLFQKYYRLVYKLFIIKGVPPSDAEDFTAELFIKLIEALKTYQFEKPFPHFLRRIVRNRVFDFYRKKKVCIKPLDFSIPISAVDYFEWQELIDHCLQRVSSSTRRAILASWTDGYKRKQIAELLLLPIGTINSNIERGKTELRKCIQEQLK